MNRLTQKLSALLLAFVLFLPSPAFALRTPEKAEAKGGLEELHLALQVSPTVGISPATPLPMTATAGLEEDVPLEPGTKAGLVTFDIDGKYKIDLTRGDIARQKADVVIVPMNTAFAAGGAAASVFYAIDQERKKTPVGRASASDYIGHSLFPQFNIPDPINLQPGQFVLDMKERPKVDVEMGAVVASESIPSIGISMPQGWKRVMAAFIRDQGDLGDLEQTIPAATMAALVEAEKYNFESVAIVAFGTGDFGISGRESASLMIPALLDFFENHNPKYLKKITFVMLPDGAYEDKQYEGFRKTTEELLGLAAGLEEGGLSVGLAKKLQVLEQEGLSARLVWPNSWPDDALIEVTGEPFAVQRFLENSGLTPVKIDPRNLGAAVQVWDEEWAAYLYAPTAGLEERVSLEEVRDRIKDAIKRRTFRGVHLYRYSDANNLLISSEMMSSAYFQGLMDEKFVTEWMREASAQSDDGVSLRLIYDAEQDRIYLLPYRDVSREEWLRDEARILLEESATLIVVSWGSGLPVETEGEFFSDAIDRPYVSSGVGLSWEDLYASLKQERPFPILRPVTDFLALDAFVKWMMGAPPSPWEEKEGQILKQVKSQTILASLASYHILKYFAAHGPDAQVPDDILQKWFEYYAEAEKGTRDDARVSAFVDRTRKLFSQVMESLRSEGPAPPTAGLEEKRVAPRVFWGIFAIGAVLGAASTIAVQQVARDIVSKPVVVQQQVVEAPAPMILQEELRPTPVILQPAAFIQSKSATIGVHEVDAQFWETGYGAGLRLTDGQRVLVEQFIAGKQGKVEVTAISGSMTFHLYADPVLAAIADQKKKEQPVEGVEFDVTGLRDKPKTAEAFSSPGLAVTDWMLPLYGWVPEQKPPVRIIVVSNADFANVKPVAWVAMALNPDLSLKQVVRGVLTMTTTDAQGNTVHLVFA